MKKEKNREATFTLICPTINQIIIIAAAAVVYPCLRLSMTFL
jgi:hypothetical protein